MPQFFSRRLIGAAFLGITLVGCTQAQNNRPASQPPTSIAATAAPTAAATAVPIAAPPAAPTAAPLAEPTAAPAAPAAAPGSAKLPDLSDPRWTELLRGAFDIGDTEDIAKVLLNTDVVAQQGFTDEYLAGRAALVDVLVIEEDGVVRLQIDPSGVTSDGEALYSFAPEAAPAAFLVSSDPGSSYLLHVIPLDQNGLQLGDYLGFNGDWAPGGVGGYTVTVFPQAGMVGTPEAAGAPAEDLAPENQAKVAAAALRHLADTLPGTPVVVGAVARSGDYAVAQASVFGEERPRMLYLRAGAGGWEVVLDTTQAGMSALANAGVPLALGAPNPRLDMLAGVGTHLQDPRGQGAAGTLTIAAFADSFARVEFAPADPATQEGFTMFFAGTQSGWRFITAGSAFTPVDLDALRIPVSVR